MKPSAEIFDFTAIRAARSKCEPTCEECGGHGCPEPGGGKEPHLMFDRRIDYWLFVRDVIAAAVAEDTADAFWAAAHSVETIYDEGYLWHPILKPLAERLRKEADVRECRQLMLDRPGKRRLRGEFTNMVRAAIEESM